MIQRPGLPAGGAAPSGETGQGKYQLNDRGPTLMYDTINVAYVTSNRDVDTDKTQKNPLRILVADDDRSILDLYGEVLSCQTICSHDSNGMRLTKDTPCSSDTVNLLPRSFDIVTCQQAGEAVDAVKNSLDRGRPFSIAIIDVRMPPGPDGIWAAEQIRAMDANVEIVIVTGHRDIHPRDIVYRVPPAHKLLYIQKPFQPWEIQQFVSSLSMKWNFERKLRKVHNELEARVKEKTRDLKNVNGKLDGIINAVTDYMSMIDQAYTVVWENPVGKNLFGKHAVGDKCYKVYFGRETPCPHCMVRNTFSDGMIHEQEKEIMGRHGNKMIFWCTCNVAEYDKKGCPKSVVAIHRDITKLKQIEKDLQEANHKLVLKNEKKAKFLSKTLKKMGDKEKDLIKHRSDLEKLNKEMIETNRALSVLARNIDKNKEVFEKKIYETCMVKLMPIIKDLKNNKSCQKIMADLDVLETNLSSIFSTSNNHHEIINYLTDQEMRVASLIKRGLTSQKISNLLCISEETVKTHRKNIRKKLKINNTNTNLISYLKSNMPSDLTLDPHRQPKGFIPWKKDDPG